VTITAIVAGGLLAHIGAHRAGAARSQTAPDEVLMMPRADALRAMSLGYRELAADLVYMRAVIYFGTEVAGHGGMKWLDRYLDTIVQLDPRWKTPYRWAGVATMYNGMPITRDRVELSNHFLRMGVDQFPSDWELPFMLGCNLLFEMHPRDAQEKARFTEEGATWIRRASLVGGGPSWAALLAATILRKEGREDAAVRHLEQVYYATSDERTREDVKNRLIGLKSQIDFARETADRAAFEKAWQSDLPYVSSDLYAIIGPRPDPAYSLPK
jgi:hypothetical protein